MADKTPARPSLDGLEEKWSRRWQEEQTYAFDRSADRARVFAIDTPPPTVSGSLHIGHIFSFTHTDLIARFQRMRGKAVFYPMGWDDNGLPTERRVQNYFGVRCDPSLPYDPSFTPPATPQPTRPVPISRRNFIELCIQLTQQDEAAFEEVWRRIGLSVDWSYLYTTIGDHARETAQRAFLRNLARGEAYQAQAPTMWDVTFATTVAQAEVDLRERAGAYHRLRFGGAAQIDVDTTRPELLPACVALVCHPDDERYAGLVGGSATTPLFGVPVPILAHPAADPGTGTGIAMVCTFGDMTDVTWWRDLRLPIRLILGRDGRLLPEPPSGVDPAHYTPLAGATVAQARSAVVESLRARGELIGEPRPIRHLVAFYENGEQPLEILATRQWYLRNGGRDIALRDDLVALGRRLRWVPPFMQHRYVQWVSGLTGDWLISRQRYFGVPFPVWYPLSTDGEPDYDRPILPPEDSLPVDPSSDVPVGYQPAQRGQPGGFIGELDVMDTWATSSLTPQIAGGWARDPQLFARVFPMDLRPQSHEIIRTWLFSTIVRSRAEQGVLPWHTAVISGWILDPDRKKMSKRTGTALTPTAILDRYGSDAARYWAASIRPGLDTQFEERQLQVGRRLATKLLNASAFTLRIGGGGGALTEALDQSMLTRLSTVVDAATAAFAQYDHTAALAAVETFFWAFCDDYIELVKERGYGGGPGAASARAALRHGLDVQLRLLAPFLPFVTEEIWSWLHPDGDSIHTAQWPSLGVAGDPEVLSLTSAALGQVRRAKSQRKLSLRAEVAKAVVAAPAPAIEKLAGTDLRAAGHIGTLELVDSPAGAPLTVTLTW